MSHHTNPRRLTHAIASAALRGAAAAIGSAPITLAIWWITHK
jgi:hypothetical protein